MIKHKISFFLSLLSVIPLSMLTDKLRLLVNLITVMLLQGSGEDQRVPATEDLPVPQADDKLPGVSKHAA